MPRGRGLPEASWRPRHRGICVLLWVHVLALPLLGVLRHEGVAHALFEAAIVGVFAAGAGWGVLSRPARSTLATLGLLCSSAVLVHFFDGLIELHFHFFVMVAVIALYQAWSPFLLALTFVLVHHSLIGAVAPHEVYNHQVASSSAWVWALIHGAFILAESLACLVYWRVTEDALDGEREARIGLEKAHQDLAQAQQLSGIGSWDWDIRSNTVTWSDHLYTIAGVDHVAFTPTLGAFLELVHEEDRARVREAINLARDDRGRLDYECRMTRPDGQIRAIHTLGECMTAADGTLVRMFGTCHDVTERKLLQQEIEHLAYHDALTGLANRRLFLDRLAQSLTKAQRTGRRCAVLFVDLDDFKTINDTLGHSAGDQLLCEVARRLQSAVRAGDTVARFGGDEFALLCEDADLQVASRTADRISAALRRPLNLQGRTVFPHGSIGIAAAEGTRSADDILRDADAAMYTAKTQAPGSYTAFPSTA